MSKEETKNPYYIDPQQDRGRPRLFTDMEEYGVYRQWEDRGNVPAEQIALDNKISMSTLARIIRKYRPRKKY